MSESPIRIGADFGDAVEDHGMRIGDVFAPPTPEEYSGKSSLDQLREALQAPVVTEPVTLRVPGRPGVSIRCHTRMTQEQRVAWQKRATPRKRRQNQETEVDEMLFACLVLANTCEAILFNGIDAHDDDGNPLTFASQKLWQMVDANDPAYAIRRLFGVDAHVLLASGEVLLASGFDDDLDDSANPTGGSSAV